MSALSDRGGDSPIGVVLGQCGEFDAILTRSWRGHVVVRDINDLKRAAEDLTSVETLILIAGSGGDDVDGSTTGPVDLGFADQVLEATSAVRHVVALSTGMVYGAGSPRVVHTESDPVLDHPSAFVQSKLDLERRMTEWANSRGARLTILRPCVVVRHSREGVEWMKSSWWSPSVATLLEESPERQFLAMSDLVSAIRFVVEHEIDGIVNLAPEGSLSEREQLDLVGMVELVKLPTEAAAGIERARYAMARSAATPEVSDFGLGSWVLDSSRMRAAGWYPESTNEEAFVASTKATWWSAMSARRRQELSLAGLGALAVTGTGIAFAALRRHRGFQPK